MCDNLDGPNAPFCAPTDEAQLSVGQTVDGEFLFLLFALDDM